MLSKLPKLLWYLLGAIFGINILQAHFTDLIFDEAYYWYYAKNLDWGYFDHPPMVAWLIKASGLFFDGELGVRFMSCLLSVGTLIVLWSTIDNIKKKDFTVHFIVLLFSMPLVNAYGFFTLPDTPLLFFTALFLWVYKKFIDTPTVPLTIGLGLVMAALMYSKYNAVIIILLVLLSNLKMVLNKKAWLAVAIALLCYVPHFMWLYEHDFIPISYHLSDRPNQAYDFFKFTGKFFLDLIALFGFTFPMVYWAFFKTRSTNKFTKALLYLAYGVVLFFFASSFQRRVQTQWLIVICIPIALLVFNFLIEHKATAKWILRLGILNILLLFIGRIGLIYEPLFPITYQTHGHEKWINEIENAAVGAPIVFENSYTDAPMYEFYTGKPAITLNNFNYRKNQYSIDGAEASVQNERVYYLSKYVKKAGRSFPMGDGRHTLYGTFIDNFESYRRLECVLDSDEIEFDQNIEYELKVYNPYDTAIRLDKIRFGLAYLNDYKEVRDSRPLKAIPKDSSVLVLKSRDTTNFMFKLPKTKMEDPGYFRIGISENRLPYGLNGTNIKLK